MGRCAGLEEPDRGLPEDAQVNSGGVLDPDAGGSAGKNFVAETKNPTFWY
jgi:hypothetical protein